MANTNCDYDVGSVWHFHCSIQGLPVSLIATCIYRYSGTCIKHCLVSLFPPPPPLQSQALSQGEIKTKKPTLVGFEQFLSHLNASTPNETTSTHNSERQGEKDTENTLSELLSITSECDPPPALSRHPWQTRPLDTLPLRAESGSRDDSPGLAHSSKVNRRSIDPKVLETKPNFGRSIVPYHVQYPLDSRETAEFSPGEVHRMATKSQSVGEVVRQDAPYRLAGNVSVTFSEGEVPTIVLSNGIRTSDAEIGVGGGGLRKPAASPGELHFPQHRTRGGIDVIDISRSSSVAAGVQSETQKGGGSTTQSKEGSRTVSLLSGGSSTSSEDLGVQRVDKSGASLPRRVVPVKPLFSTAERIARPEEEGSEENSSSGSVPLGVAQTVRLTKLEPLSRLSTGGLQDWAPEGLDTFSLSGESSPKLKLTQEDASETGPLARTGVGDNFQGTETRVPDVDQPPAHFASPSLSTPSRPPLQISIPTGAIALESTDSVTLSDPDELEPLPVPSYSSDFDFSTVSVASFS